MSISFPLDFFLIFLAYKSSLQWRVIDAPIFDPFLSLFLSFRSKMFSIFGLGTIF